jgi:hypothetical protein
VSLEIRAYDHGRTESFRPISTRFFKVVTALGAASPELAEWQGAIGDDRMAIASERDADTVVAAAARMWKMGERELVAYGPWATAAHRGIPTAKLSMVAGNEPLDLAAWVPNQLEIELFGTSELALRAEPKKLFALVQSIVAIAQPAWLVVAHDGVPRAPAPPFADGRPAVGWVTYLSSVYPPIPRTLPSPATAHDLGTGTMLVAHSSEPKQEPIEKLAGALTEAKVLVPARAVKSPAR